MKWYPLAHLAAVTMSCFRAELQTLQLLFPNSASGIARALPSFLLHIWPRLFKERISPIQRINHYPANSVIDFRNTYPLDSDLSGG